jgi:hypothetical protein
MDGRNAVRALRDMEQILNATLVLELRHATIAPVAQPAPVPTGELVSR